MGYDYKGECIKKLKDKKIAFAFGSVKLESEIVKEKDFDWEKYIIDRQVVTLEKDNKDNIQIIGKDDNNNPVLLGQLKTAQNSVSWSWDAEVGFFYKLETKELANQSEKLMSLQPIILLQKYPSPEEIKGLNLKEKAKKSEGCSNLFNIIVAIIIIAIISYLFF